LHSYYIVDEWPVTIKEHRALLCMRVKNRLQHRPDIRAMGGDGEHGDLSAALGRERND
jgi:hypothetical protein